MLFVNGGNNTVGVGTGSPAQVSGSDTALEISGSTAPALIINDTGQGEKYQVYADSTKFKMGYGTNTPFFTFDASNSNTGIGTVSPVSKLTVTGQITAQGGAVSAPTYAFDNDTNTGMTRPTTDTLTLVTAGTERMRIKSDGYVGINTNSPSAMLEVHAANNITAIETQPKVNQNYYAALFRNSSGNDVGNIESTASSTAFNTSSDYRLKENVDYTWDATTRLKQLKPARFNFIVDETNTLVDGFLAHEVSSIVPEAISGEKDGTETRTKVVLDASGNQLARNVEESDWIAGKEDETFPSDSTWEASKVCPKHQAIDHSKLVPLLVKTIQELEARITTLEG